MAIRHGGVVLPSWAYPERMAPDSSVTMPPQRSQVCNHLAGWLLGDHHLSLAGLTYCTRLSTTANVTITRRRPWQAKPATCDEGQHPRRSSRIRWMSRPVSRVLFPGALRRSRSATIHLGGPLPARSSGLPAGSGGPPSSTCAPSTLAGRRLLDLAPGGVYLAAPVTRGAGGLLHHRFTLTGTPEGGRRSVFCGTVPRLTPGCR